MSEAAEHPADLQALLAGAQAHAQRYEAHIAGGGGVVTRQAIRAEHLRLSPPSRGDGAIDLICDPVFYRGDVEHIEDHPRVVFLEFVPAAANLPVNWKGWDRLEATVVNGPAPTAIELTVFGARSRLLTRRDLVPGESATLSVDLRDLPLAAGINPPYEPQSIRLAFFPPSNSAAPSTTQLRRLALVGHADHTPLIDRFGQRIHADWPGKIRSNKDFIRARDHETAALDAMKPVADRGRFGGWTAGPKFPATGFFRVQQDSTGRWWYADPDGLPFWSTGPTGIRLGDATTTAGREEVFADIPTDAPAWCYDDMGRPRFYAMNVARKYGSVEAWRARQRQRLHKWGCNTVANWSDPLVAGGELAYVKSLSSRLLPGPGRFGHMPDVFDPAWEPALRAHFQSEATPLKHDPWLIGYFVDNEMPWGTLDKADLEPYAERYFSAIRRLLKEADPNHLYLGCRFVRVMPDPLIPTVAGRYVDVLSVNAYSIIPRPAEFDAWFAAARKPIQIGEHQFALRDPRGLPTPWMAMTADERRAAIPTYSRAAAALPYCLGTHWFQFGDQILTGRPSNGENMLIGLVDITDQPYEHMHAAFRQIADEWGPVHDVGTN